MTRTVLPTLTLRGHSGWSTPWLVYWVLVGSVPFVVAALVALVIAAAAVACSRFLERPPGLLEIGSAATFLVLTALSFSPSAQRWMLPLSFTGILATALTGVLIGKPFVRELARTEQSKEVLKSDPFDQTTTQVTWIWVATFAAMTVSSLIPPIVAGDAATPLSYVFSWEIPFVLLGGGAIASRVLMDRMIAEATSPHTIRRTTFLAFKELEIDQLFYLAQQKAEREVGAGMERYDVKIGTQGVPLTSDESRESWPATYKVRERKH